MTGMAGWGQCCTEESSPLRLKRLSKCSSMICFLRDSRYRPHIRQIMADLLSLDVGVLIASLERGGTVQSSESIQKVTREFNRLRSELVEFDSRV